MMKTSVSRVLLMFMLLFSSLAIANAAERVEQPASCELCGMDRGVYNYSRALVEYEDGTFFGTCSINCAWSDISAHPEKKLKSIRVADFNSSKLLDASSAVWTMGGDERGVMTVTPKWAFASRQDAEAFIAKNGGVITSFEDIKKSMTEETAKRTQKRSSGSGDTTPSECGCKKRM